MYFNNFYKGKKVLITGHTGFKGSWLTLWLTKLGATIIGVSKDIPTSPSLFESLNLEKKISHHIIDVRNLEDLTHVIDAEKPDIIFHLAAQAIVSTSFSNPIETFTTNVIGTMNILEVLRTYNKKCQVVLITSDKCYDNVEWVWGYKETDSVGGKDIYSGSKGAAELVIKSYFHSFFKDNKLINIAVGRAGNVIGGGDWAIDRIVVDCMRAWSRGEVVDIRSPYATRPWQHVLEPLSGYLQLAYDLSLSKSNGEAYNFGPKSEQNRTVIDLLKGLSKFWKLKDESDYFRIKDVIPFHEAGLLKLNCDKALFYLNWESNLNYEENVEFVSTWYYNFYNEKANMFDFTLGQITKYENLAKERNRIWTIS